jgi:NAD(P)H-hydrate epimerase
MDARPPSRVLTRASARRLDRLASQRYAIPSILLMENAAVGLREIVLEMLRESPGVVLVVCGPGNNGGDGLALARHLDNAGVRTIVAMTADPDSMRGDAATNLDIVCRMDIDVVELEPEDPGGALRRTADRAGHVGVVVDAIFGTGLTRPIEGGVAEVVGAIEGLRGAGAHVLSVDTPSGLDADTGEALGATVRADVTATFVAPKAGFSVLAAQALLGDVRVVGIGAPRRLLEELGTPGTPIDHHDDAPRGPHPGARGPHGRGD